jgi:predicted ester cyclase
MSLEDNKAVVRRMYEAFNEREPDALDTLLAPDFVDHTAGLGQAPGPEGLRQTWAWFHTAFPDVQVFIEEMIAEGDKVASYISFHGIQPHREHTALHGSMMEMVRIVDGKISEMWNIRRVS